jgi:hypothetical protein
MAYYRLEAVENEPSQRRRKAQTEMIRARPIGKAIALLALIVGISILAAAIGARLAATFHWPKIAVQPVQAVLAILIVGTLSGTIARWLLK